MFAYKRYGPLLSALLLLSITAFSQNKSNKGKEFWLGYGHNVLFAQGGNSQQHVLYLSAEAPANVTVSVNGTAWSQTVSIPANTVNASVIIPKSGPEDARIQNEGLFTRGVHIVSDTPIVVYAHQQGSVSSGATMLMPVETFGYTYYSLNFTQISNYPDSYSWFYIIASENNTRIEISPADSTEGGWLPGQVYSVNLNKGELYNVFGKKTGAYTGKDMSGSKIVSVAGADGNCHPVAVFSGSSRNIICTQGNGGEVMQQQIFPANAWGTRYLTYHTIMNANGDITTPFLNYYRVAVRKPGTLVRKNGVPMTGLINNFYYEYTSTGGDLIEADEPVLVSQYMVSVNECSGNITSPLGDPEMIFLSPVEQGVKKAYFYATRSQAIDINYVNIILPQTGVASLRIDNTAPTAAEIIPHPADPAYAVVIRRLFGAAAQHHISSDSSFIASVYGSGFVESYGYNVGTLVNNLNSICSFSNTLNTTGQSDSFTCPNSPFRITARLAYRVSSMHWKLSQVPGLSPGVDSFIINPQPSDSSFIHGRKYYTYTLQQDFTFSVPGTYAIPITYTAPDIDACNQSETTSLTILVKAGPGAGFSVPDPACLADNIQFTGTPTGGFTIRDHRWTFADNSTALTQNTVKQFVSAGNQSVRYQILSDNGCTGDSTRIITLHPNPAADFTISGQPFCTGKPVQVLAAVAGISNWNWDLGNGNSSSAPPFMHLYPVAGDYTVRLVTANAAGCYSVPFTQNIHIATTPVVNAGADTAIRAGSAVVLNPVVLPAGTYNYLWSPGTYLSSVSILNPVSTPIYSTRYRLTATDIVSGCTAEDDILVSAVAGLFIPTGFTPNGDGKNDSWVIPGLALYPGSRVLIFNRGGQQLFESKDYTRQPWDGRYAGQAQPAGVYVYMIELNDSTKKLVKGTFVLIR